MESELEGINVRASRLNSQLLGKFGKVENFIYKESVLDALLVLYDACNDKNLIKTDKQVSNFVNKYRKVISDLNKMRVNIGDFEIKDVIGRGQFGEVKLVKEKQTGDIYALKLIKKSECLKIQNALYENEKMIMATTTSPWHTTLQYSFQDQMNLYLIMEYSPGGDLAGLLSKEKNIPETAATFYLAEILLAINDLHSMGYVHRDIKPENILLDRLGHIKLADFGSAVKLTSKSHVSNADHLPIGTPEYIAPEVLQSIEGNGNKKKTQYNHLCDYWSLGVIAFQLVVGKTPFASKKTTMLYSKIMNHTNSWKFPPEIVLSQAYHLLIKGLLTDQNSRLDYQQIVKHSLFKQVNFYGLNNEVPPVVPHLTSSLDTSNFYNIPEYEIQLDTENFKSKTEFNLRNLAFIGFTFVKEMEESFKEKWTPNSTVLKDKRIEELLNELASSHAEINKYKELIVKNNNSERQLNEKNLKLEKVHQYKSDLEKELATSLVECSAMKRTLELEQKHRNGLERQALDMIKSIKSKWEVRESHKVSNLREEVEKHERIKEELTYTNELLRNQLEQALQMNNLKQQISVGKVDSFKTESVVGLESRMNKITTDYQEQLCKLQCKFSKESHEKEVLSSNLNKLKNSEEDLKEQLQLSKECCLNLQEKNQKSFDKIKQLESKEIELKSVLKKYGELKDKMNESQEKEEKRKSFEINEKKRSKQLEEEINNLKKNIESKETFYADELQKLEQNHINSIKELESKLKLMIEQREQLEKKLLTAQTHNEPNEFKIQMLEESLQKLQQGVSTLENKTEMENVLKDQIERLEHRLVKAHEESVLDRQELSQLKTKFWRLEKDYSNAEIDKRILKRERDEAENKYKKMVEKSREDQKQLEETKKYYQAAVVELSKLNESFADQVETVQNDYDKAIREMEKLEKVKNEVINIIQDKDKEIESMRKNLEGKDGDIGKLKYEIEQNDKKIEDLTFKLESSLNKHREFDNELENFKRKLHNTEMNYNALKEACVLLESQIIEYENLYEKSTSNETGFCDRIETLLKDLEQAYEEVTQAKREMKEEKSLRYYTENSNKILKTDLKKLQDENQTFKEEIEDLKNYSNQLLEELSVAEEKIIKRDLNLTNMQQIINDLQTENEELKENNSKFLTDFIFSKEMNYKLQKKLDDRNKENSALLERTTVLENLLMEQTNHFKNREIKWQTTIDQHIKLTNFLQAEMADLKKKKTFKTRFFGRFKTENPQQSTKDDKKSHTPLEQNVEYRTNEKCSQKNAMDIVQYDVTSRCLTDAEKNMVEDFIIHGWIKIPNKSKTGWDRTYATLTESALKFFADFPKEEGCQLLQWFEMNEVDTHGKIILKPARSEIDVRIADSDLNFVFKFEIMSDVTCLPIKSIVIMTLSELEKNEWFKAIQSVLKCPEYKYEGETILTYPNSLDVNCLVELEDKKKILLGTNQGLYSCREIDELVHISGPAHVQKIALIPAISLALMIVDAQRYLVCCDLNLLRSLSDRDAISKPHLPVSKIEINHMDGFHTFQCSDFVKTDIICVASDKQIIILKYEGETRNFSVLKTLDTAEPASCILFLEHSFLVGVDKLFEIDLKTFIAEEFLDSTDPRLVPINNYCRKNRSFPLYVAEISPQKEFLLCYREFAVFVDIFGRTTRDAELKWTLLPCAFHYSFPYLYVVQFTTVEIFKIKRNSVEKLENICVEFEQPKLLGSATGGGLFIDSKKEVRLIEAKEVDNDFDDVIVCSKVEDEEVAKSEFSFTSSTLEAMDQLSSDEFNLDLNEKKKVTFSND